MPFRDIPSKLLRAGEFAHIKASKDVSPSHRGKKGELLEFNVHDGKWNVLLESGEVAFVSPMNLTRVSDEPIIFEDGADELIESVHVLDQLSDIVEKTFDDASKYTLHLLSTRLEDFYCGNGTDTNRSMVSFPRNSGIWMPSRGRPCDGGHVMFDDVPLTESEGESGIGSSRLASPSFASQMKTEDCVRRPVASKKNTEVISETASTSRGTETTPQCADAVTACHGVSTQSSNQAKSQIYNFDKTATDTTPEAEKEEEKGKPDSKKKRKASVFADEAQMKKNARVLKAKAFSAQDHYKETGIAQAIAKSTKFENFALVVIAFNSLWIAVDTDNNDQAILWDADLHFIIVEYSFFALFSFEVGVRFLAYASKWVVLKDKSFLFDSTLVGCMGFETTILPIIARSSGGGLGNASMLSMIRLMRVFRMARMLRLLRAAPELMILIKAIMVAFRSVFFTLVLLLVIIYVFAIAMVQLSPENPTTEEALFAKSEYYHGVIPAMTALLLNGSLPDLADFVVSTAALGSACGLLVVCFVFIAPLTLMGMLLGVLVEVVGVVASVERETIAVEHVKSQLRKMLSVSDEEMHSDTIDRVKFRALMLKSDNAKMIASLGVDSVALVESIDYQFSDKALISFVGLFDLVLQLRGHNTVTVKDVIDLRKYLTQEVGRRIEGEIHALRDSLMNSKHAEKAEKEHRHLTHRQAKN